MANVAPTDAFLSNGGTEVAPMSTTSDLKVALRYATRHPNAFIFKLRIDSFMQRGANITAYSCFPSESEYLFPPLCYLQPTSARQDEKIGDYAISFLEVVPHW